MPSHLSCSPSPSAASMATAWSNSIIALVGRFHPAHGTRVRDRNDPGTQPGFRGGGKSLRHLPRCRSSATMCWVNVLGTDPGLRDQPDQRLHHPGPPACPSLASASLRPPGRVGPDAVLPPPGDLCPASTSAALPGPDDLRYLDVLQPHERRVPQRHGCKAQQMSAALREQDSEETSIPATGAVPAQPLLLVGKPDETFPRPWRLC